MITRTKCASGLLAFIGLCSFVIVCSYSSTICVYDNVAIHSDWLTFDNNILPQSHWIEWIETWIKKNLHVCSIPSQTYVENTLWYRQTNNALISLKSCNVPSAVICLYNLFYITIYIDTKTQTKHDSKSIMESEKSNSVSWTLNIILGC